MVKSKLTCGELMTLQDTLSSMTGYLTDNSCSDPDCCGGPFYQETDFEAGVQLLAEYGLEYVPG